VEIRSLFAFKELPDILALLFSYPFCRSRLLEFQADRLLATDRTNEDSTLGASQIGVHLTISGRRRKAFLLIPCPQRPRY
jgi:hypothetical protein